MAFDIDSSVIFPLGAATRTTPDMAASRSYDAVIVGGGIAGSILATQLSQAGHSVLILEAGPGKDVQLDEYEAYLSRFYGASVKDNQAPYAFNPNARMPRSTDAMPVTPQTPDDQYYIVQDGPFCTDTTFTRVLGGTTMHWEAKALRMLPEDFDMATRFGHGLDWPLGYDDLEPYYRQAEREIGRVRRRRGPGVPGHDLPARLRVPDAQDAAVLPGPGRRPGRGRHAGGPRRRAVQPADPQLPAGPQRHPEPGLRRRQGLQTRRRGEHPPGGGEAGAARATTTASRSARSRPSTTRARRWPRRCSTGKVDIVTQSVASRVHVDKETGRVSGIEYKRYHDPFSPEHSTHTVHGRVYALAANAIENARLMLASGLPGTSELVGRNLMDHAYLLRWALLPEIAGTFRGTNCTGGITDLRGGQFRQRQAGFSVDIHNDGWGWATGSPYSDLLDHRGRPGQARPGPARRAGRQLSRQLLLAFMIEVAPEPSQPGHRRPPVPRPAGQHAAGHLLPRSRTTRWGRLLRVRPGRRIFGRLGAEDHTTYDPRDYSYVELRGPGLLHPGRQPPGRDARHGHHRHNSVTDAAQRSWDHENLYLVGGGSMPTIGTSNITLTLVRAGLPQRRPHRQPAARREETRSHLGAVTPLRAQKPNLAPILRQRSGRSIPARLAPPRQGTPS